LELNSKSLTSGNNLKGCSFGDNFPTFSYLRAVIYFSLNEAHTIVILSFVVEIVGLSVR